MITKLFSLLTGGFIMIIFGAIFVGVGFFARDWMVPSPHLSANGVVVDLAEVRSSRGSTGYKAVVEFTTSTGQVVRFQDPTSSNPPAYRRNQEVTVLYDPENPEFAVIDSPFTWLPSTAFIGFGGLFVVLGIFALLNWLLVFLKLGGILGALGLLLRRSRSPVSH